MSAHHGSPFIQHHFDDARHQFETGKLGMWIFLAQEVLFFSALFVAYISYRSYHPELFYYAHKYLDVTWGAVNTIVLILSSLTAAWAVRCAQLENRKGLILTLSVTILCAFAFLGIKYVEYTHKIHDGILFGAKWQPEYDPDHVPFEKDKDGNPVVETASPVEVEAMLSAGHGPAKAHDEAAHAGPARKPPPQTNMFFTIYFAMTGLHGIHVLAGIFVFVWLLRRAIRGDFTKEYFGPIDYAALYWHLVDLIWIFLFPLLYLIH